VESKKDKGEQFAMKEMAKARIITKKSVQSVLNELSLLALIRSDFIVNVHFAFQDKMNLYLIMDLLLGGDLRYHIARRRKFREDVTQFFVACLIHALEAVHAANIIHRDIKPENLVFDNDGYLRLTDFGVAKILSADNANETSGTPGYMAPEVMCRQNHGLVSDYFAVGVIAFECMMGRRPYVGRSRREIREQILTK
jgi:serum/glucocorticoid-regulated kinase 2